MKGALGFCRVYRSYRITGFRGLTGYVFWGFRGCLGLRVWEGLGFRV